MNHPASYYARLGWCLVAVRLALAAGLITYALILACR